MKHLGRPFLATILALCLFCLTGFALATGASAHTTSRSQVSNEQNTLRPNSTGWLGQLSLDWYCKSAVGMKGAELDGSSNPTVDDWGCVSADGRFWTLSREAACRWQYSDGSAEDYVDDYHNPYSMYCFDAIYGGGLDLDWYCKSQGYIGVTLDFPDTVYDWNCVEQNGTQVPIGNGMNTACQSQYSPSYAVGYVSRFTYYHDAFSVQCWAFGAQGPTP